MAKSWAAHSLRVGHGTSATTEAFGVAEPFNLRTFPPSYFALVMATGIVSLATRAPGLTTISSVLFWLNLVAYGLLWVVSAARFTRYRAEFLDDLTHHARGAGFLAIAASTCVLGGQVVLLTPWTVFARLLWLFGVALCLGLSYTFFAAVTVSASKPKLETGISSEWLLLVVSVESISVLGTLVAPALDSYQEVVFVSVAAHLVGAMLYVLLITLLLGTPNSGAVSRSYARQDVAKPLKKKGGATKPRPEKCALATSSQTSFDSQKPGDVTPSIASCSGFSPPALVRATGHQESGSQRQECHQT